LNRLATRTIIALLLTFFIACAPFVLVSCNEKSFSEGTEKELEAAVEALMNKYGIPGSIVGVWWEGRGQYCRAFGEANIEE
jgi:hypothetical protein